jgi:hypothetical protein
VDIVVDLPEVDFVILFDTILATAAFVLSDLLARYISLSTLPALLPFRRVMIFFGRWL